MDENPIAFLIAVGIVHSWVEGVKYFARIKILSNVTRRKLMHILTGPIFMLTWVLFSRDQTGSIFASVIVLGMTLKFVLIGIGLIIDEDAVNSISRTGNKADLLKGPVMYGLAFVIGTLLFWQECRSCIIFGVLCFGDGFAELFGRKYGNWKLPWSKDKSWAGSLAFVISSIIFTFITYAILQLQNSKFENVEFQYFLGRLIISSVAAGLAESITTSDYDNMMICGTVICVDTLYCMANKVVESGDISREL